MGAPKGNQFWKLIDPDKIGRNPKFKTPADLWERCKEYFQECDDNPIKVTKISVGDKGSYHNTESLKVPYTWQGLYVFLEVCDLDHYKTKEAFSGILTHIGNVIYNQKFTGATIGIFNSSIIAKDLSLVEKTENKTEFTIGEGSIPIKEWIKQQAGSDSGSE